MNLDQSISQISSISSINQNSNKSNSSLRQYQFQLKQSANNNFIYQSQNFQPQLHACNPKVQPDNRHSAHIEIQGQREPNHKSQSIKTHSDNESVCNFGSFLNQMQRLNKTVLYDDSIHLVYQFKQEPDSHLQDPDSHLQDPDSHLQDRDSHLQDPDSHLQDISKNNNLTSIQDESRLAQNYVIQFDHMGDKIRPISISRNINLKMDKKIYSMAINPANNNILQPKKTQNLTKTSSQLILMSSNSTKIDQPHVQNQSYRKKESSNKIDLKHKNIKMRGEANSSVKRQTVMKRPLSTKVKKNQANKTSKNQQHSIKITKSWIAEKHKQMNYIRKKNGSKNQMQTLKNFSKVKKSDQILKTTKGLSKK